MLRYVAELQSLRISAFGPHTVRLIRTYGELDSGFCRQKIAPVLEGLLEL